MNLDIKNVVVRSFSLDFLEVTWEISNTTQDVLDYQMYVLRSESPEGPWNEVAGPFEDRYRFIDNRVNVLHRWRNYYYKIRSISKSDTSSVSESEVAFLRAEPDLIAKEIQRQERLLWEEFAGRRCYVWPVRTFGQRCPTCYDGPDKGKGHTSQRRRANCPTCYDTTFLRGYLDPIEIYIQIDPSPKSVQTLPITERQQSDTSARMPNFPIIKPRDIIVEAENRRWRVVSVSTTERLRSVVHQELRLHELTKGDVEFQLPMRVGDLRDLEPSPMRNFINPSDLENFEGQAIRQVLSVYRYKK
jgi:hypothetical protein